LGVLLYGALVPVAWLHAAPELLEWVLRAVVRDSSPRPYCFDHLSGFGVLNSFGLVLLVGFWERWGDDCVQNAGCEAVQEEADGFFASDGVSCAADEFFEVCDVLIYFGEAHFAFV
jgi:hypothetical protein